MRLLAEAYGLTELRREDQRRLGDWIVGGCRGRRCEISDAHDGLRLAITRVLGATWQRCRVHWARPAARRLRDRHGEIRGLTVGQHIARLRKGLIPLAERCGRIMREALAALQMLRASPSSEVERSRPIAISVKLDPLRDGCDRSARGSIHVTAVIRSFLAGRALTVPTTFAGAIWASVSPRR